MQIRDLELFAIEVPRSLDGEADAALLIRIETDNGLAGWGEARSPWQTEQLPARLVALRHVLVGRGVFMIEELTRLRLPGGAAVTCAVEMALWDVIGRAAGEPICNLLGGLYRDRVRRRRWSANWPTRDCTSRCSWPRATLRPTSQRTPRSVARQANGRS
jgi:L-alanine-DL-glutamate epimerase-like enolase superfamily enzyme